jgi:type IV secretory pathway VirB3-like protein
MIITLFYVWRYLMLLEAIILFIWVCVGLIADRDPQQRPVGLNFILKRGVAVK